MERIHREEPSYWPYGLATSQFNGGLYLVKESATTAPVGFVGWQRFEERGKNVGYYAVGILPAYRERGFAKSAVAQVIREVREHCDDVKAYIMRHNEPSKALARSLSVDIIEKAATTKQQAIMSALGAIGSAAFFDQAADPSGRDIGSTFQPWKWDKERALMGGLNAILGAGGGAAVANGNPLVGASILALAPAKDLAMKGIGSLYKVDNAATEAAKSFAHERSRPDPETAKNVIESVPKEVWMGAGGLGLGALALALYNSKKKRNLEERRLAQEAAGVARVTLPTDQPGDLETQIQLPVGDLHLSNAILQNLGRDTRRRLRQETRQRTKRRGERKKPAPELDKAASLTELVQELNKYAMGQPAPAGNVPTPPQLGQNPAMRMQNQQAATAQSITPAPAANPAIMQAEQKAMETEQAAMQQQAQTEQASQQAQMEQEQRFQQELTKSEQEKETLKLQLEKEKAVASLQKEQAKAQTAMQKAQADGAASASDGENSIAGRLISNRLDRLQSRVGSIKAASQGTMDLNGQTYVTGAPPAPVAPTPAPTGIPRTDGHNNQPWNIMMGDPTSNAAVGAGYGPTSKQMEVNGTAYSTGTTGVPGSIDPATGGKVPEPFKHIRPEAPQLINNNPGSNGLFPSVGLYRASYGGLLDTAFDWTLKKMLTTPKPQQTRYMSQAAMTNAPDKMGIIRDLYSNAITTNPMLANV